AMLTPDEHIAVQATVQEYTDSSISKTVNGPASDSVDDVKRLYSLAYELGCKGVTYYRDGSRDAVLTAVSETPKASASASAPENANEHVEAALLEKSITQQAEAKAMSPSVEAKAQQAQYRDGVKIRPDVVQGYTRRVRAPEGKVYVTLNCDEDGPLEVFVTIGKAGSDVAALADALGRLISLHLRIDSPISQNERAAEVARQLRSIGGSTSIGFGPDRVRSLPDAVARTLELHLAGKPNDALPPAADAPMTDSSASQATPGGNSHATNGYGNGYGFNAATTALYTVTGNLCPQCGNNTLHMEEGCKKCVSCGYSEC
ncbi:MAG: adenosylcobalamin-dependent ribonucleoside-diphosphate reductase, partial [Ktedonobacterales bacterium]